MSEFDPDPPSIDEQFDDPYVTRLVRRDGSDARARLLECPDRVTTSVTFVVPGDVADAAAFAKALRAWKPANLRAEVLVAGTPDELRSARDAAGGLESGVPLRPLGRPAGGRAAVLEAAADAAEHEFLAVVTSHETELDSLLAALANMWADGCDAAMVEPPARRHDGALVPAARVEQSVDAAAELATWLGPAGVRSIGRVTVLRRWAARWVFSEVTRAIEPWVEVADRVRLLGIGIVHFVPGEPLSTDSRTEALGGADI